MLETRWNSRLPRRVVQAAFALTTLWIGIRFLIFYRQLLAGSETLISRPPGVEGFLPISALISLKYWLLTGIFNGVHPAGLLIFLVILATALLLKRGFCSWVCPIGLINEALGKVHVLLLRKPRRVWLGLDYPLRGIKYLLLGLFCWTILLQMPLPVLKAFIYSPYNQMADLKMLVFFLDPSTTTMTVLSALVLLSIFIRNFWCRYLCPYGALLGMASWLSPWKIRRNAESCTDCRKCTKACPVNIDVHRPKTVRSDECHACLECVAACPVKDTLALSAPRRKWPIKPWIYAILIVVLFLATSLIARLLDYWQTRIPEQNYRHYIHMLDRQEPAQGSLPR